MSDDEQALEAMTRAEHHALEVLGTKVAAISGIGGWARDRLRLIARDRATLERHACDDDPDLEQCVWCDHQPFYPCPDAQAVIDYWTEGT